MLCPQIQDSQNVSAVLFLAGAGFSLFDFFQQLVGCDELEFNIGKRFDNIEFVIRFFPVFDPTIVNLYVAITQFLDGNCRLVGEYSPVTHSVGDNQLFLVFTETIAALFCDVLRHVNRAWDLCASENYSIQAVYQDEIGFAVSTVVQHLFHLFGGDNVETFQSQRRGRTKQN